MRTSEEMHDALDLAYTRDLERKLFHASWERMVLLASTLEFRSAHGQPMPSPNRDHDILTLIAMLSCVTRHTGLPPSEMTIADIEAEMNSTEDDDRFARLELELCERRADARMRELDAEDLYG